jgi:glycosyltransferase involved in cell wall biosynthesis
MDSPCPSLTAPPLHALDTKSNDVKWKMAISLSPLQMFVQLKNGLEVRCKMKITFVLPGPGAVPMGGYKVVYEYANHLSRKGHEVTVLHSARGCVRQMHPLDHVKNGIRYFQAVIGKNFRPDSWFSVDSNVNLICVPSLSERWVPNADVVIATAWHTAEWVTGYSAAKGIGFYLIQGLETWEGQEEKVYATWKGPLNKVVIAKWLLDVAKQLGQEAVYIPNGLSADEFQMDIAPEERDPKHIMMLFHEAKWKGSTDGVEALLMAQRKDPEIRVTLFGVPPRPAFLPERFDYYQQPERTLLRALYNQAALFVAPSLSEGWGLPSSEAMLCGAALVATDVGGHREFAFHEETALLSPIRDPTGLADNILRLVRDSTMRASIAHKGHRYVQQFTWERASDRLETVLCGRGTSLREIDKGQALL